LKPQHPYDSKHLKQVLHRNEMEEFFADAKAWMQSHVEAVLIGAVVLAALIFGGVYFVSGQKQRALDAAKALNEAQAIFQQAGSLSGASALQAFNQAYAKYQGVASAYDGTPQAQAAKLGQANALLAQGKAPDAEREYAALDSRKPADAIGALAAYGRARALELQGKAPDAAQAYDQAAQAYPDSAIAAAAAAAALRLGAPAPAAKKG
jgi:tetratricopeptide (TPR) repeat protein